LTQYHTENLWQHLLYYGEYYVGSIGVRPKKFYFYIDASQYDPEGLLFHIHRNFLNFVTANGVKEEISPEAFNREPKRWFSNAICASLQQYLWDNSFKMPFISSSSSVIAKEYVYEPEQVMFSKCGLKFIKINHNRLKSLALYPQYLDIK
jgi:hypothetical protein